MFQRRNEGRFIAIVGSFLLSAICMATLILEAPKWSVLEWGLIAGSILFYIVIYALTEKFLGEQYTPLFRASSVISWSRGLITFVLVVAYLLLSIIFPQETCSSVEDAFSSAWQPYENSPAVLVSEVEKLTGFVNGLTVYALSEAQTSSFISYLIIRGILVCSSFYAVASLLSFCCLRWSEMKRIIIPLHADTDLRDCPPIEKEYVLFFAVGPALALTLFLIGNYFVSQAINSNGYTFIDTFVEEKKDIAIYIVDGHYKQDQLRIGVLDGSKKVSDAITGGSSE